MKLLALTTLICASIASTSMQDFTVKDIKGNMVDLGSYKGKVALVVNVASFCGFTKHYEPLEKLYEKYKDKGLVVLGFPSNDFGEQEPGTDAEIMNFCSTNYHVTFPMFSKITVKGDAKHPLYAYLTSGGGNPELAGEIPWNFEKFLVGKDGKVAARFKYKTDPSDPEVVAAIEKLLAE